ncbi:MAG: DUF1828 domain-containing protein [Clostridium sp.]|nr:DUF1828 domain-containing protein [Clostridium sp.]
MKEIGVSCSRLPVSGSEIYCITTPFFHEDGDGIHVFAETIGEHVRFFDDGDTLFHVIGCISVKNKRDVLPIRNLVEKTGVILSDIGEIEVLSPKNRLQEGFNKIIRSILMVSDWEKENRMLPEDAISLANEVEIYLSEWKPNMPIKKNEVLTGISGRELKFEFLQDNTYIDVISSTPQASSAEIRKLADVRGVSVHSNTDMMVILDDRQNKERAKEEAAVLSQFADVMMMTVLKNKISNTKMVS